MIRERVCAGVRNAKRNGIRLGRKRVVFNRDKARQMQLAGSSVREIASAMGVGKGTIQRFLAQKPTGSATV
jgi:DNA invertase Pin-like site-specific DNA recombinase